MFFSDWISSVFDVRSVNEDFSVIRLVKAGDQARNGRFTRSGRSDEGD